MSHFATIIKRNIYQQLDSCSNFRLPRWILSVSYFNIPDISATWPLAPFLRLLKSMERLNRNTWSLINAAGFSLILMHGILTSINFHGTNAAGLPDISWGAMEHSIQIWDVLNLNEEHVMPTNVQKRILKITQASLPPAYQARAFDVAKAVITEANRWHLDPMLVLAVIKTESRFNPLAIGRFGEIGLMQIKPATAQWLAGKMGMHRRINLRNPIQNIKIGTYYMARLRKRFSNTPYRYVAAYNMGAGNVQRLLASKTEPHVYANRVFKNYKKLIRSVPNVKKSSHEQIATL